MTTHITAEQLKVRTANAEFLGGYGWLWDNGISRWIAGGSYRLQDGSRLAYEQRCTREDSRCEHPETLIFEEDR